MDNITSKNQKGGITAKNVNIGQINNQTDPPEDKSIWPKILKIIIVIGLLASIVTILAYFNLYPRGKEMNESTKSKDNDVNKPKQINVTSYNQSGGITAYNVNIGQQDRKLTQQLANQLTKYIIENDVNNVKITSVMGDQEAFQFASVIKAFLVDQGYSVNGVNQAVYSKPVRGQIIEPGKDPKSVNIIIGGKSN